MIGLQTLTISYGKKVLVDSVDAEFAPGTIYGLVAPNGYGKTTLLRAMAGLPGPRVDGSIVLDEVQGAGARGPFYDLLCTWRGDAAVSRIACGRSPQDGLRYVAACSRYRGDSGANTDRRVREDEGPYSEPGYEVAAYLGDCVCDGCAVPPIG